MAMQTTAFVLVQDSFQLFNTIVIGHSDNKSELAGLGLGQLYISLTLTSIIYGFQTSLATLAGQEFGQG